MVRLHFHFGISCFAMLGPSPLFRLAGGCIHDGSHGGIVGQYQNNFWVVDGQQFSGYACRDPFVVHFDDGRGTFSHTYGPFAQLRMAGCTAYVDGSLFATFDVHAQRWRHVATNADWVGMVLRPP